jgi:hypothetical protein
MMEKVCVTSYPHRTQTIFALRRRALKKFASPLSSPDAHFLGEEGWSWLGEG